MRRYLYFMVVTIFEVFMIISSIIIGVITTILFYNVDKYWDNGPLPGYEQASASLGLCNDIRLIVLFVFLLINLVIGIISIIRTIIKLIVKLAKGKATTGEIFRNILCWLETVFGVVGLVIIFLITQLFTYATGV